MHIKLTEKASNHEEFGIEESSKDLTPLDLEVQCNSKRIRFLTFIDFLIDISSDDD